MRSRGLRIGLRIGALVILVACIAVGVILGRITGKVLVTNVDCFFPGPGPPPPNGIRCYAIGHPYSAIGDLVKVGGVLFFGLVWFLSRRPTVPVGD